MTLTNAKQNLFACTCYFIVSSSAFFLFSFVVVCKNILVAKFFFSIDVFCCVFFSLIYFVIARDYCIQV